MDINQIPVLFNGRTRATAPAIAYKYDQKQKLLFEGVYGLPNVFTVDFCNEGDAVTKPEIAHPDGVYIPDEYLLTGKTIQAFFWLTGPNSSSQTRYEIEIPVRRRPARSNEVPTPEQRSVIDELIDELNTGVQEAEQNAEDAEAWAKGTREGVPVEEGDETYHDNAKYYAEEAGKSESAVEANALKAEGYAAGTQNGTPVESGIYFRNNASYYAGQAGGSASAASGSAASALNSQRTGERYAKGTENGVPVESGIGYHDNAKYYKEQAENAKNEILGLTAQASVDANTGTPAVSVDVTEESGHKKMSFSFRNLKGGKGDPGQAGNGISSIELLSTSGQVKTYRINMTNGSHFDFAVTDGKGISSIAKTSTSGLVDTYTITFTDNTSTTFTVTNAKSITSCVLNADYTLTINFNDNTSTTTTSIRGAVGKTPDFSIGTVTTLDYDEDATASITGTPENPVLNLGIPRGAPWKVYTNQYAARWNKETHQMERVGLAVGITTDVTNFAHRGSLNENYNNPFDSIAPWSGMKVCNIDIGLYMALDEGDSLTDCVSAWEGDPDFSWDAASGVWRYTPEFWGRSYESDGYVYYDVSPTEPEEKGYIHYPESIKGRWHGRTVTMTLSGTETSVFLPLPGMPDKQASQIPMHDRAKAYGGTLDNIWTVDADNLLAIVEYADMNMQMALGEGCDAMYRQSSDKFVAAATDSNVVKVNKNNASAFVIPGAIFDIGTSNGGIQKGSFRVVSVEQDPDNSAWLDVTIDGTVTVTTGNFWSVHGICNAKDSDLGSMSGYLGTAGKSNVYYRGAVIYGNLWFYVLGAYRQTGTQHIWIAHDPEEADAYDALDTSVHFDTGLALPVAEGDIQILATVEGVLSAPPFCIGIGGNSTNPVGDHFYTNASAANTVLRVGGIAAYGAIDGPFYGSWINAASGVYWYCAARPVLKSP